MDDVLLQPTCQKFQQATVADAFLNPFFQPGVRNAVKVAFEVGVHDMRVAFLQPLIDFPQRVLAASAGSESIAHRQKFLLEDRFYHPLDRRLDNPVLDGGDAQRARLAARFGYFHSSHGGRLVPPFFQVVRQFAQIPFSSRRKAFDALSVDARRALVGLDLLPGRLQRLRSIDFVDQTEPFVSFDAVVQRRQHAIRPNGAVDPVPVSSLDKQGLLSRFRHCRSFAHALAPLGFHASTFLPAFPQHGFAFRASRGLRRFGTTQALTPALVTSTAGLPAYLAQTSQHSASNHVGDPVIAFAAIPACPMCFRLRHGIAGSPSRPAESSSSSCGLPVRLRLLPTPPRDDAVTFSFGVMACPGTDFHHAVYAPSRAHDSRIRGNDGGF